MNIFVTDNDPIQSAVNLDVLRVNKMIIESAALLSNAIAYHGGKSQDLPIAMGTGKPYRTTAWQNHPCCLWVKASKSNYLWLLEHMRALIEIKTAYNGRVHSAANNIDILTKGSNFIPNGPLTDFVNCTPYKSISNTILAYKMALAYKWLNDSKVPKWLNKPIWLNNDLIELMNITERVP